MKTHIPFRNHHILSIPLLVLVILPVSTIFAQHECAQKTWEWGGSRKIITYHTADLDNDGNEELITSSIALLGPGWEERSWQIFDYLPEIGTYENTYFHRELAGEIRSISTYDYNNDGFLELFLIIGEGSNSDNVLKIINGQTFEELHSLHSPGYSNKTYFYDIDHDGSIELVFNNLNRGSYTIVELDSLKVNGNMQGGFAELANIDNDPDLESLYHRHTDYFIDIYDFDTSQSTFKHRIDIPTDEFGIQEIKMLDVDEDGKDEIIVAQRVSNSLLIYDADSASLKWEFQDSVEAKVFPLANWDVNEDGTQDLLYATDKGGSGYLGLACLDIKNRRLLWKMDTVFRRFNRPDAKIMAVNLDEDADFELLAFDGGSMSIYDLNPSKISFEVTTVGNSQKYFPTLAADVDLDGELEYIFAGPIHTGVNNEVYRDSSAHVSYGSTINIYDANTYLPEFQSTLRNTHHYISDAYDITVGDLDNDGTNEIIIAGQNWSPYNGKITILDANTYEVDTTISLIDRVAITNVEIADLENDGEKELIIGVYQTWFGPLPEYYIYGLNGKDLSPKFQISDLSQAVTAGVYSLRTGDIDGNGDDEIVFQMSNTRTDWNHTYVAEIDSNEVRGVRLDTIFHDFSGMGLDLKDMNGDGIHDIISGNVNGITRIYDYANDSLIWEKVVAPASIFSLRAYNVDSDAELELVMGAGGALAVYDIREDTLKCASVFDYRFGMYNNFHIGDKNSDGTLEVFSSALLSIVELELGPIYAVGIEEVGGKPTRALEVYPNPNNGEFFIKFSHQTSGPVEVRIFDLMGTLLLKKRASQNRNLEINLDTEIIPHGVYLVQVWENSILLGYTKVYIQ